MATKLYEIVKWAEQSGERRAVARIKLMVLGPSLKEGVSLTQVAPTTACSPELLREVHEAASFVVGSPCPVRID